MDLFAAFGEYQVALFVRVVDVARSPANERSVNTDARARRGSARPARAPAARSSDDEIGLLEHLGMALEVGGRRFVADVDADFA